MQAILVLKVRNLTGVIRDVGVKHAVDMIYDFRDVAISRLGVRVSMVCHDMVVSVLPSVQDAIDQAKHIMDTLCTMTDGNCIPIGASIGFGDLYQTVDGSYWGVEMSNAISLVEDSAVNEILLTDSARSQISHDLSYSCPL